MYLQITSDSFTQNMKINVLIVSKIQSLFIYFIFKIIVLNAQTQIIIVVTVTLYRLINK